MKHALGILFFSLAIPVAGSAGEARLPNAVEAQDDALIQELLEGEAGVNAKQVDGMTALHWAAYQDDAGLGSLL